MEIGKAVHKRLALTAGGSSLGLVLRIDRDPAAVQNEVMIEDVDC